VLGGNPMQNLSRWGCICWACAIFAKIWQQHFDLKKREVLQYQDPIKKAYPTFEARNVEVVLSTMRLEVYWSTAEKKVML